ncbi:MAG: type IV fimbrial biogenesis protein FimT [Pseudohongiellaceae bacterium]|jgi:type IV fimbrial biogenesis protein FimT
MNQMNQKDAGFTLIELLITIAIAAILVAAATPSFQSMVEKNSVSSSLSDFSASLRLARAEAIRRGLRVVMCPSDDQANCGSVWANGWLVFVDEDGGGTVNGSDEIVRIHDALASNNTLLWSEDGGTSWASGVATSVQYNGRGIINTNQGTFKMCSRSNNDLYARALIISIMGSLRHGVDGDSNGIFEDDSGGDLSC